MPDHLAGIRQAFADTFEKADSMERCLHYVMPTWVEPEVARRATMLIGGAGHFSANNVLDVIDEMESADPRVKFALGREMSAVMYVETYHRSPIYQILESETIAKELDVIDPDEQSWVTHVEDLNQPHSGCHHETPPPGDGVFPEFRHEECAYIRAWWDS